MTRVCEIHTKTMRREQRKDRAITQSGEMKWQSGTTRQYRTFENYSLR